MREGPSDLHRQTPPDVRILHREAPKGLTVGRHIVDEIPTPDRMFRLGRGLQWGPGPALPPNLAGSEGPSTRLPHAMAPLVIHPPAPA